MKIELKIDGMHCGNCALDIKETLEDEKGIEKAEVSFDTKVANIEFDENKISQATIVETVKNLGYQVTEI
jgi:copper chaperone CopZ